MPYYEVICKCSNLTYMNCNKRTILTQFLLSYDDDDDDDDNDDTRHRHYDLH